jgi:hypothetical protein
MLKRSRKGQRKGKKDLKTLIKEKVLTKVSALFIIIILLIFSRMSEISNLKNHPEIVVCFNPGTEHLKFHRNKEKPVRCVTEIINNSKRGDHFFLQEYSLPKFQVKYYSKELL